MPAVFAKQRSLARRATGCLCIVVASQCLSMSAASAETTPSASEILQELRAFRESGSVLYVAAHPDDENTQLIAYLAKQRGLRVGYLSLTRGEGGQNLIGPEFGDALGVIRTEELLAARRIDGGQQFFTRARDFGYSKSADQTLAKWDRQEVLADMVRVIRTFRPDVLVTRFPPQGGGTHGHHTASAILAQEAFALAADPKAFSEQLGGNGLRPWQAKRIYWNAFRGADPSKPSLKIDIGGFLPLLGKSVGEIAALSRSSHRSQGFGSIGSRGGRLDEFQPLDGQPSGKDLLDTPNSPGAEGFAHLGLVAKVDEIVTHFDPQNPAASLPALLGLHAACVAARRGTEDRSSGSLLEEKTGRLNAIIQHCLGLYVETTVPQAELTPGEKFRRRHTVVLRAEVPVALESILSEGGTVETIGAALRANQPFVHEAETSVTPDTPLSQPSWLRVEGTPGMYGAAKEEAGQHAKDFADCSDEFAFSVGGETIRVRSTPVYVTADPGKGEIRRAPDIISPVSLALGRDVQLFTPGAAGDVKIEVTAHRDHQEGILKLDAPAGWKASPDSLPFRLAAAGDHAEFTFTVTPPAGPQTAVLTARATIDGKNYDTIRQEIRYDHIPTRLLQPPARIRVVCLDLAVRGKEIGYLPGAGDGTAEALTAMGCHVTTLSGADLYAERLKRFDAVVIGVRAFNVRTDLTAGLPALFAYVENGGNVVEQYNTPRDLKTARLGPYELTLSPNLPQWRVTDEKAPVTFLVPEHPALTTPNRIDAADFAGWVQERGLNFPSDWDRGHFTALLACGDPGETPLPSGLLVARHGKGYFVYTGLSFFRQLPAGVPGAYRLFANLISLGKEP